MNCYRQLFVTVLFTSALGFAAPVEVREVSPPFGPEKVKTSITIRGVGFERGSNVTVGSLPCETPHFISSVEIRCVAPAQAKSQSVVTVTNPDGTHASKSGFYYYGAMVLGSYTHIIGAGNSVTIPVTGGVMPYRARVILGSGRATAFYEGVSFSGQNQGDAIVEIRDVAGNGVAAPLHLNPRFTVPKRLQIKRNEIAKLQIVGGVPPYTSKIVEGEGTIDSLGRVSSAYPHLMTVEVKDSYSNRGTIKVFVEGAGALNDQFGKDGGIAEWTHTDFSMARTQSIALGLDGSIYAVTQDSGSSKRLRHFSPSGVPDIAFGAKGINKMPIQPPDGLRVSTHTIVPMADGAFLFAGSVRKEKENEPYAIAVFKDRPNFTPDVSFGKNGVSILALGKESYLHALKIDSIGRILLCVTNGINGGKTRVVRLLANGQVDNSYGNFEVKETSRPTDFAVQPDGAALLLFPNRLLRIDSTGHLDKGFNSPSDRYMDSLAVDSQGKILLGTGKGLFRLLANGQIDSAFKSSTGPAQQVIVDETGAIETVSWKSTGRGKIRVSMERYDKDGTKDQKFGLHGSAPIIDMLESDTIYGARVVPKGSGKALVILPLERAYYGSAWLNVAVEIFTRD